jgi:hypothetical protein
MKTRVVALATALSVFAFACSGDKLTHVPAPGAHTEIFNQATAAKIDLLWVIDNSGSMADKQAKLAASFQRFIDEFSRGDVDYHIAVTTTDVFANTAGSSGTFYGTPPIITSADDDPLSEFQQNVKVGILGSGNEEGFAACKAALDQVNNSNAPITQARQSCENGCSGNTDCVSNCDANNEPQFLRPDAYLYVIFVSDDEDHSESDAVYWSRYLETVKGLGNEEEVTASAIVGDADGPPCDARAGIRYTQVAQLTGGVVGSICDTTFDQNLTNLAVNAVGLKRHFLLGTPPQQDTLNVVVAYPCDTAATEFGGCTSVDDNCSGGTSPSVLGLICHPLVAQPVDPPDANHPDGFTAGWSYQCSDNSIYFHRDANGDSVPGLRSQVQVTYQPAPKGATCSP